MKRFFRKALVWAARLLALLVILLLLFYAEEDWRGARAWAACQRDLAAKGESLDLRQLAPPGKPEDDLSKVPIFAELYQESEESQKTGRYLNKARIHRLRIDFNWSPSLHSNEPRAGNYLRGRPFNLTDWQTYYHSISESGLSAQMGTPAQDVLLALNQFDPELEEIDAAVSNPNAFWPINYENPGATSSVGFYKTFSIAEVLSLRAVAHLENHETDWAEKDYLFSFRLEKTLTKGGDLVSYCELLAVRNAADTILWEGLRRHAWNDTQLREMESALALTDLLALGADGFRVDRASLLSTMKFYQPSNVDVVGLLAYNSFYYYLKLEYIPISRLRPKGWWDEDRATLCVGMQKHINAINVSEGTLSSDSFPFHDMSDSWGWNRAKTSLWSAIYVPISAFGFPAGDNIGSTIAKAEIYRRLARLSCRLEEYRLAHGQYPDQLDALPDLPPHLNQEVLSEQPFRYQRKGDGYLLYSIGWDQKDNGGVLATDDRQGDWPWPSP